MYEVKKKKRAERHGAGIHSPLLPYMQLIIARAS